MSTSVASVVKHFPSAENGFTTTLASTISSGATTVPLNSVAGYANGEVAVFVVDPADASKKQTFTGVIDTSGVQVTSVVWTAGTNQVHAGGATVVDYATATHISMISKGLLVEHAQEGTHTTVTATSLSVSGATTLTGALTPKSWDGWIYPTDTWSYASATSFTISGVDRTAQFPKGAKLKLTQTSAKYFYVTSSTFSTNTTVNITGGTDYTLANAAITSPAVSYMLTPQAFPKRFAYTPTTANLTLGTGGTATGTFNVVDGFAEFDVVVTLGTGGSSGSNPTITYPVTSAALATSQPIGWSNAVDTGNADYFGPLIYASTTTAIMAAQTASGSYAQNTGYGASVPFAFGDTDKMFAHGRVPLA